MVVDYVVQPLEVLVGTGGKTLTFSMDGEDEELIRVTGNLTIDVAGFFRVSGGFAIEKSTKKVILEGETEETSTEMLSIGANKVDAFVGLNGGTADAIGIELSDITFGLVILNDKIDTSRKWVALKATDGGGSLLGIDGLTLSADSLLVNINTTAKDGSLVDFKSKTIEVATSTTTSIVVDMDGDKGELIQAAGNIDIDLFNFFQVSGGFAFEKSTETLTLSDEKTVQVDKLTIGSHQVDAFAGFQCRRHGRCPRNPADRYHLWPRRLH